jgi:hypothetical protein
MRSSARSEEIGRFLLPQSHIHPTHLKTVSYAFPGAPARFPELSHASGPARAASLSLHSLLSQFPISFVTSPFS